MPLEMRVTSEGIRSAARKLNGLVHWAMPRIKNLLWQLLKGPSEGWLTFILLLLSVLVAVWSVGSVNWVPTPGLYRLALCGVLLGLLLAKIRFNGWLLAVTALLLGVYVSFHQLTSLIEGATVLDQYAEVWNRLFIWGQAFVNDNVTSDTLPLSFLFVLVSWVAGFICSWSFFRRHNIWGAVLPSGIAIIANVSILAPGAHRFQLSLYLFIICLLMARLFILERDHDWGQRSIQRFPADSRLLPSAFRFSLVIILVTSLLPAMSATVAPVASMWDTISSPMRAIGQEFAEAIGGLPGAETESGHSFGPTQPFGGSTTMGEEPALIVEAPFPIYLRARSYDVYTHKGWETSNTQMVSPEFNSGQETGQAFQNTLEVDLSVAVQRLLEAGEPVYLGGYPVDMSIGYQLEVPQPARYQISLSEDEADHLPPDLQQVASRLREMSHASQDELTESDIRLALPEDVWLVSWEPGTQGLETVTVERRVPIPADTVSVCTDRAVSSGRSYGATILISTATDADLLTAGTVYPGWVSDRYLQLPDTMPLRVIDLAQELTEDSQTPYEKAVAICEYLRTLEYTLDMQAPPEGTDGADHFLFEAREGYCQYFASSMAVLLRASGVPSRMAAGYGPGELVEEYEPGDVMDQPLDDWQERQGTFVVHNSHSWTEVFFPGYGWIPFEPTPAYPVITRVESVSPPQGGAGTGGSTTPPDGTETQTPWDARPLAIFLGLALIGTLMWLGWRRLLGQVLEPRVAYARIGYLAALSGIGPRENLTPREYGRRLAVEVPEIAAALDRIVHAYVRISYSKHNLNSEDRSNIARAWPQVRNQLLRRALHSALPVKFLRKRPRS